MVEVKASGDPVLHEISLTRDIADCIDAVSDSNEGPLGSFEAGSTSSDETCVPYLTADGTTPVQRHGLMLVLEMTGDPRVLPVQTVSENSGDIIARSPDELFALRSFTDILEDDQAEVLREHIHLIQSRSDDPTEGATDIFTLYIKSEQEPRLQILCALHQLREPSRFVLCDIETSQQNSGNTITTFPRIASETGRLALRGSKRTSDEQSRPTKLGHRKSSRRLDSLGILRIMSQVQNRLARTSDLVQLVEALADIVKEVTNFDRVLVCQYDRRGFGRVIAEAAAPTVPPTLYHGLRFLSKERTQRKGTGKLDVLYDREAAMCALLYRPNSTSQVPIDLSPSFLREPPPIRPLHIKDTAVRSAISIPIYGSIKLWGNIECYATDPCGNRISFLTRRLCDVISDAASTNIKRLSSESRLRAWKMIQTMRLENDPALYKLAPTTELLRSFRADSGFLLAGDQIETLGRLQHPQEALMILKYLAVQDIVSVIASTDITTDFPDLRYPSGFSGISGALVVPLCLGSNEFMVFFRDAKLKEVVWGGNPYRSSTQPGVKDTRRGFEPWTELTTEMVDEWSEEEIETATLLCLLSERAKKALRLEQTQLQGDAIAELLLKNSAHRLRTPLNAIVTYLEIARDGPLIVELRENLDRSHTAFQSLTKAIDGMLSLGDDDPKEG